MRIQQYIRVAYTTTTTSLQQCVYTSYIWHCCYQITAVELNTLLHMKMLSSQYLFNFYYFIVQFQLNPPEMLM